MTSRRSPYVLVLLTLTVTALLAVAPRVFAAPPLLTQFGETGSGAGQTIVPRGIAADPTTGHLYVADQVNRRVVEFTAWGEFVKTWGWDVVADGPGDDTSAPEDQFEICVPADGDVCQAGSTGSGTGQFGLNSPRGVALDSEGNIYVVDLGNLRVQKFSPAGQFLLMLGGGVNQGPNKAGNVCAAAHIASGDTCGGGNKGTANGQFSWPDTASLIAIDLNDEIYVGDVGRIQRFDTSGVYQGEIAVPGDTVHSLAVDPSGNLYVSTFLVVEEEDSTKPNIRKLSAAGTDLCTVKVERPLAIATDTAGNVYVVDGVKSISAELMVRKFNSSCGEVKDAEFPFSDGFDRSTGIAVNTVTVSGGIGLYVSNRPQTNSYIRAYGPAPAKWPPPPAAPTIEDSYAVSVDTDSAVVRAGINPRFWGDTAYHVEYGTAACSATPCQQHPLNSAQLGAGVVDFPVTTKGVLLSGLAPDTTYHYRFVSESSGGGPVFGPDRTFTTFAAPQPVSTSCANQAFRLGPAAALSDCRAYEMVSPVDKANADIAVLLNSTNNPAGLDQAALDGERITYSSSRAFGDAVSAPFTSQYIASRGKAGWSTDAISPPRAGASLWAGAGDIAIGESQYKAFSDDLCSGWLVQDADVLLAPGAAPGYANLYRRQSCGAASGYEALSTAAPPLAEPVFYIPHMQAFSADGSRGVFVARDKLTPDAATTPADGESGQSTPQLYEAYDGGKLRLASVLPDGSPCALDASAGTRVDDDYGFRFDSLQGAVSDNGSRIFFSCGGRLFVRIDPDPGFEGEEQSAAVSSGAAHFWGAAADGSRAIYSVGGLGSGATLNSFEVDTEATTTIATGVRGVMGMSEDATRIYLASTQVLDPDPNSEGEVAAAGQPNLYLYEAGEPGSFTFVATLSAADASEGIGNLTLTPLHRFPYRRLARVTPDGTTVAFMSAASLTGYDNLDVASGKADAELFHYDATEATLRCVSCNPSGARPTGRDVVKGGGEFWVAAQIPGWSSQTHASRVLSDDGDRLFFESFEALVLADTNGVADVYQWEAVGSGDCEGVSSPAYSEEAQGCVGLISSGQSPVDSEFVDADADGSNVFFKTQSSLVVQDPGLADIYDARVGGGFPPPPPPAKACEGEACQGAPAPPDDPTPASSAFQGAGNVSAAPARPRCAKGKVRRRGRCVAKKQRRAKRAANHNGRGQR